MSGSVPNNALGAPEAGADSARQHAVVIGAGIAGLATAALLARDGYVVTILDSGADPGGRAGVWEHEGFRFDAGPSWYLMPDAFEHYFALLGTSAAEQLDLVTLDPGYRVFTEGNPPVDLFPDRARNLATAESLEPGAGQALDAYIDSAAESYELAQKFFLYGTFRSFRPLLTGAVLSRLGKLARLLTQPLATFVGRRFRHPVLRQILGYPAVFLSSSPYTTPSLYHLMSYLDLDLGVQYPRGGFGRVIGTIAGLAEAEGVTRRQNSTVTAIDVDDSGRATGVRFVDAGGSSPDAELRLDADIVVSAADLHHTETALLEPQHRSYPESWWAKRDPGIGTVLLYLGIKGELPTLEHHNLLFTADWKSNFGAIFGDSPHVPDPASLYVCKPSASDHTVAPDGHENVFVLVPVPADVSLGSGGIDGAGDAAIEAIADRAIAQIAEWSGTPDLAERIVVRRTVGPADFARNYHAWSGGALGPAHTLAQSAFLRGSNASAKVDGLYYAGATTVPGVGLPMCLISAELVLKHLRDDQTPGPLPEPLLPRTTTAGTSS